MSSCFNQQKSNTFNINILTYLLFFLVSSIVMVGVARLPPVLQ